MLTIMGGIAEFERSLIRRTDAGIERAKRLGKKFGRPNALDDGQKQVSDHPRACGRVRGRRPHHLEGASTQTKEAA